MRKLFNKGKLSLVKILCHSEFISESPASLVGQQASEHRKTILRAFIERFRMTKTSHSSFAKVLAFTLAETLVVMGIIGVVAALTIPNLNQSTGDREKVAKVKKIYANLEDAYGRATAVYGPIETWVQNGNAYQKTLKVQERLMEFLKVSKTEMGDYGYYNKIILSDGSELSFPFGTVFYNMIPSTDYPLMKYLTTISVDIDGSNKGKNKDGWDIFRFTVTDQGILPSYTSEVTGIDSPAKTDREFYYYATAWVIMNGNMDYLKCYDDLSWDGQTSCK